MSVVWTARVAPIDPHPNPPTPTRERWKASHFASASERPWQVPVLIDHDPTLQVGCLYLVRERGGWVECDFVLHDPEAEELMRIGQHVSVGARQMTNVDLRWVNELSIVPEAAIRGAQVIHRREIRPTTTTTPAAAPATTLPAVRAAAEVVAPPAAPVLKRGRSRGEDEIAELERRLDWLDARGVRYDTETVITNMQAELTGGHGIEAAWAAHRRRRVRAA
jgi:hypothetical protein